MFCSKCGAAVVGKFCSCCGQRVINSLEAFRRQERKVCKDFGNKIVATLPPQHTVRDELSMRHLATACWCASVLRLGGDPVFKINGEFIPRPDAYEILREAEQRAEKLCKRLLAADDF